MVKTTEMKNPLGMLEWLRPLEILWKVEVIDCSQQNTLVVQLPRRGVLGKISPKFILRGA